MAQNIQLLEIRTVYEETIDAAVVLDITDADLIYNSCDEVKIPIQNVEYDGLTYDLDRVFVLDGQLLAETWYDYGDPEKVSWVCLRLDSCANNPEWEIGEVLADPPADEWPKESEYGETVWFRRQDAKLVSCAGHCGRMTYVSSEEDRFCASCSILQVADAVEGPE